LADVVRLKAHKVVEEEVHAARAVAPLRVAEHHPS
jgi:hypothetical protein